MNEEIVYVDEHGQPVQQQEDMIAPPMAMPSSDKADLLEKIDPTAIVNEVKNRFMGKELINGVWTTSKILQDRALTEKGATELANLMLCVSSQNVSISKLKDDEIRKRALNIAKAAMIMCVRNWKEYGIKGTDQLYYINEIVFSNTFITLKQPEGEGIRKMLIGTITEQKLRREDESDKGWSLLPTRR